MGPEAVERGLERALGSMEVPPFVLGAGFSGALDPTLRTGDLILADEVVDEGGRSWETTWPGHAPRWKRGRILSTPRLIADASEKRGLKERTGALAVDMESAELARVCRSRGVPFGCLRVILDEQSVSLSPVLGRLLTGSKVAWGHLFAAVLCRPTLVRELWRLGKGSRRAAGRLDEGLGLLLGVGIG
jgi:adenosylhomocysteine nucleosidase